MKSRSIGIAAAVAAATAVAAAVAAAAPEAARPEAAAAVPEATEVGETVVGATLVCCAADNDGSAEADSGAACDEPTGTEGVGLSSGGTIGAAAADEAAGRPGGGEATASGSSISSSGKSGSCSSNGETDNSPKAAGRDAGPDRSTDVPDKVGTAAGVPTGAVGESDDVLADARDMVGGEGDVLMDVRVGTLAVDVPEVSLAVPICDALDVVLTGAVGASGDVLADIRDVARATGDALTGEPVRVGTLAVDAPKVAAVGLLTDAADVAEPSGAPGTAPLREAAGRNDPATPPVGFAADAPAPRATPTGLEIFLAAEPGASGLGELRGAALTAPKLLEIPVLPVDTPTGREAPAEVVPPGL